MSMWNHERADSYEDAMHAVTWSPGRGPHPQLLIQTVGYKNAICLLSLTDMRMPDRIVSSHPKPYQG